jgi:hypothetical protein
MSPPITTVLSLGVTTTVSADRLSITGVFTVSEIATVRSLESARRVAFTSGPTTL